ncbi:MAG: NADH-quinone oxidoreductase subunit M [Nitrospirae bacterium]|nr:NADH-quinone oxidoreductase subunit M [Nitrospirota bacterium]
MIRNHLPTLITFLPLAGAVLVLMVPSGKIRWIRGVSQIATLPSLVLSVWLFAAFDRTAAGIDGSGLQFVEKAAWIPAFNVQYFMGVDGLSILMVVLTSLLSVLCIPASRSIQKGAKGYFALFLLLETGMLGVFFALDFFLFYVFWEVMLLPMYFLIGIWGGPRKEYAAIKFFLYTLLGSVLMLVAMLAFYFNTQPHTFDMTQIIAQRAAFDGPFWKFIFVLLFIGFAIKIPLFPFHTWLPDAHVEAPTAVSVILAGVLLKMGTYGLYRINFTMLPEESFWFSKEIYVLPALAVINIIYGAFCAMAQKDFKKLVAYSSISHMGIATLGMASFTAHGLNGGLLQMFNHGAVTAMLFLLVGVIYDRAHHRDLDGFGGLAVRMPLYAAISGLAFFGALGLPGLSSFVSEVLCFLGAFGPYRWLTVVSVLGIVITAAYVLWTLQRVFLGPLNPKFAGLPDVDRLEILTLAPLAVLVLFLGVYPAPALDVMARTVESLLQIMGAGS